MHLIYYIEIEKSFVCMIYELCIRDTYNYSTVFEILTLKFMLKYMIRAPIANIYKFKTSRKKTF